MRSARVVAAIRDRQRAATVQRHLSARVPEAPLPDAPRRLAPPPPRPVLRTGPRLPIWIRSRAARSRPSRWHVLAAEASWNRDVWLPACGTTGALRGHRSERQAQAAAPGPACLTCLHRIGRCTRATCRLCARLGLGPEARHA